MHPFPATPAIQIGSDTRFSQLAIELGVMQTLQAEASKGNGIVSAVATRHATHWLAFIRVTGSGSDDGFILLSFPKATHSLAEVNTTVRGVMIKLQPLSQ